MKALTAGSSTEMTSYKDCLSRIICNPSLPKCHLGLLKYYYYPSIHNNFTLCLVFNSCVMACFGL
jgi:hypothetical protein